MLWLMGCPLPQLSFHQHDVFQGSKWLLSLVQGVLYTAGFQGSKWLLSLVQGVLYTAGSLRHFAVPLDTSSQFS
jgi:hypothetical protein